MNIPTEDIYRLVERLMRGNASFALYRLPWADECRLVLQADGEAERLSDICELNGKEGFVIAPFKQTETHPLVVIRPDITASGWNAIGKVPFCQEENAVLQERKCHFTKEKKYPDAFEKYLDVFKKFLRPLQEGAFRKLVLSRSRQVTLADNFSLLDTFVKACNRYPRMMIYLCNTPVTGTWIGSTPEILLSGCRKEWHTVALAGTMPMQGEMIPEHWSEKNKEEQAIVADYVRRIVGRFSRQMEEIGPFTARAGQLVHLKTDFHFTLDNADSLGDLLNELHPTPAVCGLPKAETYRFIHEHEGYDRRYYSGFIGWLSPNGQTDVYVNLRCMEINAGEATLYAGGGILPSSEVSAEWEETYEKMKTMRNII